MISLSDTVIQELSSFSQNVSDHLLAWQLQAEEYKKGYQLASQDLLLSSAAPKSQASTTYQFHDIQGNSISFNLKRTRGDGDCFFYAVNREDILNREALVKKLSEQQDNTQLREVFALEIRQFLYLGNSGKHPNVQENAACQKMLSEELKSLLKKLVLEEENLRALQETVRLKLGNEQTHGKKAKELLSLLQQSDKEFAEKFEQVIQTVEKTDKAILEYCSQKVVFLDYIRNYLSAARGYIPFSRDFSGEKVNTTIDIINRLFGLNIQVYMVRAPGTTDLLQINQQVEGEPIPIYHNGINHFSGLMPSFINTKDNNDYVQNDIDFADNGLFDEINPEEEFSQILISKEHQALIDKAMQALISKTKSTGLVGYIDNIQTNCCGKLLDKAIVIKTFYQDPICPNCRSDKLQILMFCMGLWLPDDFQKKDKLYYVLELLKEAVVNRRYFLLENLLMISSVRKYINYYNEQGRVPLHYSIESLDTISSLILIKHGANLNSLKGHMAYPLDFLMHEVYQRHQITKHELEVILLSYGANINNAESKDKASLKIDDQKFTALLNTPLSSEGTRLHSACKNFNELAVYQMLEAPNIEIDALNSSNFTPLGNLAHFGCTEVKARAVSLLHLYRRLKSNNEKTAEMILHLQGIGYLLSEEDSYRAEYSYKCSDTLYTFFKNVPSASEVDFGSHRALLLNINNKSVYLCNPEDIDWDIKRLDLLYPDYFPEMDILDTIKDTQDFSGFLLIPCEMKSGSGEYHFSITFIQLWKNEEQIKLQIFIYNIAGENNIFIEKIKGWLTTNLGYEQDIGVTKLSFGKTVGKDENKLEEMITYGIRAINEFFKGSFQEEQYIDFRLSNPECIIREVYEYFKCPEDYYNEAFYGKSKVLRISGKRKEQMYLYLQNDFEDLFLKNDTMSHHQRSNFFSRIKYNENFDFDGIIIVLCPFDSKLAMIVISIQKHGNEIKAEFKTENIVGYGHNSLVEKFKNWFSENVAPITPVISSEINDNIGNTDKSTSKFELLVKIIQAIYTVKGEERTIQTIQDDYLLFRFKVPIFKNRAFKSRKLLEKIAEILAEPLEELIETLSFTRQDYIVERLIEKGADPGVQGDLMNVFSIAAHHYNISFILRAIKLGINPFQGNSGLVKDLAYDMFSLERWLPDYYQYSYGSKEYFLHYLVQNIDGGAVVYSHSRNDKKVNFLREILLLDQFNKLLNKRDAIGETPIFKAIRSCNIKAVQILLEFNANLLVKNENQQYPIELLDDFELNNSSKEILNLTEIITMTTRRQLRKIDIDDPEKSGVTKDEFLRLLERCGLQLLIKEISKSITFSYISAIDDDTGEPYVSDKEDESDSLGSREESIYDRDEAPEYSENEEESMGSNEDKTPFENHIIENLKKLEKFSKEEVKNLDEYYLACLTELKFSLLLIAQDNSVKLSKNIKHNNQYYKAWCSQLLKILSNLSPKFFQIQLLRQLLFTSGSIEPNWRNMLTGQLADYLRSFYVEGAHSGTFISAAFLYNMAGECHDMLGVYLGFEHSKNNLSDFDSDQSLSSSQTSHKIFLNSIKDQTQLYLNTLQLANHLGISCTSCPQVEEENLKEECSATSPMDLSQEESKENKIKEKNDVKPLIFSAVSPCKRKRSEEENAEDDEMKLESEIRRNGKINSNRIGTLRHDAS